MRLLREDVINAPIVLHTISAVRSRSSHLGGGACGQDNGERGVEGLSIFIAVYHEKAHNVLAGEDQGQLRFDPLWDQSNVPGNHHYQ